VGDNAVNSTAWTHCLALCCTRNGMMTGGDGRIYQARPAWVCGLALDFVPIPGRAAAACYEASRALFAKARAID
jgi:hypothetical protein